jgi:putative transcriptional regulator
MAERNILKIKRLAEKSGLDANTIAGIYHNRYKRIDLNTLNRLCQVLKCTPSDLFEYKPDPLPEQVRPKPIPSPVKEPAPVKRTISYQHDRLLEALKKSVYEGDHRQLMELSKEE